MKDTNVFRQPGSGISAAQPIVPRSVLVAFVLCLVISGVVIFRHAQERANRERTRARAETLARSTALELQLKSSLGVLDVVGALVRQSGGKPPSFYQTTGELLRSHPSVVFIGLEPGGVAAEILPLGGNEKVIGVNALNDPASRASASLAMQTRKPSVAGPFPLAQSGLGIVGRVPVFATGHDGREVFWGFVSAAVRLSDEVHRSHLDELAAQGYAYALFALPRLGQAAVGVAGSGKPIRGDYVHGVIQAQDLELRLAARPNSGWHNLGNIAFWSLGALFFSALVAALVWSVSRQKESTDAVALANNQIAREKEESARMKAENVRAQEQIARAEAQTTRCQEQVGQLQARLAVAQAEAAKLSEQTARDRSEAAREKDQLVSDRIQFAEQIERLSAELELRSRASHQLARDKEELIKTHEQVVRERQQLIQSRDQWAAEKEEFGRQITQLSEDVDRLTKTREELAEQLAKAKEQTAHEQLERCLATAPTDSIPPLAEPLVPESPVETQPPSQEVPALAIADAVSAAGSEVTIALPAAESIAVAPASESNSAGPEQSLATSVPETLPVMEVVTAAGVPAEAKPASAVAPEPAPTAPTTARSAKRKKTRRDDQLNLFGEPSAERTSPVISGESSDGTEKARNAGKDAAQVQDSDATRAPAVEIKTQAEPAAGPLPVGSERSSERFEPASRLVTLVEEPIAAEPAPAATLVTSDTCATAPPSPSLPENEANLPVEALAKLEEKSREPSEHVPVPRSAARKDKHEDASFAVPHEAKPAPAPGVAEAHAELPEVEGLDVVAGLGRAEGNAKLYLKLLRQFAAEQANTAERIRDLLVQGKPEEASRLTRQCGVAAEHIGASAPQAAASELERAISSQADPSEIEIAWSSLEKSLSALTADLKLALKSKEEKSAERPPPPVDPPVLRKAVNQILPLLTDLDPGAADCLKANRKTFRSAFTVEGFAEFEQLIKASAFHEALDLLKKAAKKHGVLR